MTRFRLMVKGELKTDRDKVYEVIIQKFLDDQGNEYLELISQDCVLHLKPRKLNEPSRIAVNAPLGEPVLAGQNKGFLLFEFYTDERQRGLVKNPVKGTQSEILELKKQEQVIINPNKLEINPELAQKVREQNLNI